MKLLTTMGSLFKMIVSRDIKGFNKILNSFKILDIRSKVFDVRLVAVMQAYKLNEIVFDT
jgi:hypothetical protein